MVMMMTEMLMITSTIAILFRDDNRLPYKTQKPLNDENLGVSDRPTDQPTDRLTDGQTNWLIEMRERI